MTRSTADAPEPGTVYPPRDALDVAAYPKAEIHAGYLAFIPGAAEPGESRSPAFRWGWRDRARDCQLADDGFDAIRDGARFLTRNLSAGVIELAAFRDAVMARQGATL